MTREVLITISGTHMTEGENSEIEVVVRGTYYQRGGKHYIVYDETVEGVQEPVRNVIKVASGSMDIIKKGAANAHMQFEQDKKYHSSYATPMGNMIVGIMANRIRVDEQDDSLRVDVEYSLDVNYEHLSDCSIALNVRSIGTDGAASI